MLKDKFDWIVTAIGCLICVAGIYYGIRFIEWITWRQ